MTQTALTYVRHFDKCFMVSTIDRESSAPAAYGGKYAETMVWVCHPVTKERGAFLGQLEGAEGSIRAHFSAVEQLRAFGSLVEKE